MLATLPKGLIPKSKLRPPWSCTRVRFFSPPSRQGHACPLASFEYPSEPLYLLFPLPGMPSLWLVPCCRLLYPSGFSSDVTSSERPSGTTPSQPVTHPLPLPHGEERPESLEVPGTSVLSAPSPPPTSSHLLLYTKGHLILIYYFIFFVVPPASSFPFPFSSKQAAVASGEGYRRRGGRNSP